MKRILTFVAALFVALSACADEGMWLLPLLRQMNGKALKDAGCKLTPEQIYSVNKSSLKDAIVHFGGGCTGEVISAKGLVVTNHHCGYSSIQGLSTDEHNYLMDGFWARTIEDEIPVPDLSVTFLVSMEDVTLSKLSEEELVKQAEEANPGCEARVVSFYNDNVYYLIVSRTYEDIRFVGAPPASLGKFGGETDNWMWPRHTCDFSMFRIYSAPDGSPAPYSPDNVPYKASRSLKISLKGVQEGDYTMVMGYPGRTQRFQTAEQLRQMIRTNSIRIQARTIRQDIMWEAMCADPSVQLKYADKYASSANGWKKWQGEELAFEKLDIIGRELAKEKALRAWIEADKERSETFGDPVRDIAKAVGERDPHMKAITLLVEAPLRIEIIGMASAYARLYARDKKAEAPQVLKELYRDYVIDIDRKAADALMEYYKEKAAPEDQIIEPCSLEELFATSAFRSFEAFSEAFEAGPDSLMTDPAVQWAAAASSALLPHYQAIYRPGDDSYDEACQKFAAALLQWQKGKPSYPDANSTMRLTYGHVLPYSPKDGVLMRHFTTLEGLMEKEDPNNPEFIVPEGLKALYEAKDYGRWKDKDGSLHTCFLTNNDITGGNSGSPVLDAKGNLIGLAFDGNWESMSSDVMFEPRLQRCICVDIRYVLFVAEKLGGASRIIDELTYVK